AWRRQHRAADGGRAQAVPASSAEARRAQRRGAPGDPRSRGGPEGAGGAQRPAARPV
ncbi:MAG: hypothetical protein AVDCRST_MAG08-4098, partial [uncultured Acetobacteraceae bacterium]